MNRTTYLLGACALLIAAVGPSCDHGAPAAPPAPDGASTEERLRDASVLLSRARSADVVAKVDLLRRITALYDDLPLSADAHFELVFYLRLDPREATPRAALEAAKRFGERKPSDLRVGEGLKLVVGSARAGGYDALAEEAFGAWDAWLAARLKEATGPALAALHGEAAQSALLRRRWREAETHAAAAVERSEEGPQRLTRLVLLGDLRGQRLGDLAGARDAWGAALRSAPLGPEAERLRSLSAESIASHVLVDGLAAVNAARFAVPAR